MDNGSSDDVSIYAAGDNVEVSSYVIILNGNVIDDFAIIMAFVGRRFKISSII